MRPKLLLRITIFFMLVPAIGSAQLRDQKVDMAQSLKPSKVDDIVSLLGLKPEKFSMSHSYSVAFSSIGGRAYNSGLYLNTMRYNVSDPLTLYFQLGIQHQPFGNQIGDPSMNNQVFVSGAGVNFQPNDKFSLQLEFSQSPSSAYWHSSPFRDPISRNRKWFEREEETAKQ